MALNYDIAKAHLAENRRRREMIIEMIRERGFEQKYHTSALGVYQYGFASFENPLNPSKTVIYITHENELDCLMAVLTVVMTFQHREGKNAISDSDRT